MPHVQGMGPAAPLAGDRIRFWALRLGEAGTVPEFAVAFPGGEETGERAVVDIVSDEAVVWFWDLGLQDAVNGETWTIRVENGSPAAHVFVQMDRAFSFGAATHGRRGTSAVAWFGIDVDWECGACFWPAPSNHTGWWFSSQLFLPGSAGDESYWSELVIGHELGHWAMESYGFSPGEGGTHCIGVPAPMFADFLDALRCGGVPADVVSQAVAPYPYPAEAPICP